MFGWGDILEDFLFCQELPKQTTGQEIFKLLDDLMKAESLKCVAVFMDSAATITDNRSGGVTRIQAINPQVIVTHCMLHCQALASKKMETKLLMCQIQFCKVLAFEFTSFCKAVFRNGCKTWQIRVSYESVLAISQQSVRKSFWAWQRAAGFGFLCTIQQSPQTVLAEYGLWRLHTSQTLLTCWMHWTCPHKGAIQPYLR